MESYFALSEQFHTQSEPAFCGLGSLVVVLNALAIDPGRSWKGPWRWFDETLLDCCVSLDDVRRRGVTMRELACLAECNGADAQLTFAGNARPDDLRKTIAEASRAVAGPMLIAAYDRSGLEQAGAGHFSPIAGWHEERGWALVLDVARFKYPPHWVEIDRLFSAMTSTDPSDGTTRGWIQIRPGRTASPVVLSMRAPAAGWHDALAALRANALTLGPIQSARTWIAAVADTRVLNDAVVVAGESRVEIAKEHQARIDAVRAEARATALFSFARERISAVPTTLGPEDLVLLALVLSRDRTEPVGPALREEADAIIRQLDALCPDGCTPPTR